MSTLQFLLLEDNPVDAELIRAILLDGGINYELQRVDTHADFVTALSTEEFDLILADYALPDFHGIDALEIARNLCPETPFIFVSGSLGEELAIETLKRGATDYVLKKRLGRLIPCVQRALQEAIERHKLKQAELMLIEQNRLLESIASGQALDECLAAVCASVSQLNPRTRACFLLTDAQGLTFNTSITPDFGADFGQGLKDAPINDLCIGTCGEAVYCGQPVSCADIANDDRWSQEWRNLCVTHGILACHSSPVLNANSVPLGSLMLCFDEARMPTDWERQLANFGTKVASIVFERDRSNQALQESEEQSRNILESITDAFFAVDENWLFTYVNQTAGALVERIPGDLIGKNFWEEFPGVNGSDFEQMHRRVMRDRVAASLTEFYPDHNRWYEVHSYPAAKGVTMYFKNVTERIQAEAEREKLLQREQAAREAAELANRIKDEFLAVLSHELRSPLNPILGWTQLLQNGKLDAARQAEALATIQRNAKLQLQLIEDLLDISRIMQGKLTLRALPVSLTFVISAAVETVRLAAEAKNIQIALDLDNTVAPIYGDAGRLQQVVCNLLTNAVKFTPNSGQVTVELRQLHRLIQIRVMDTGKGINPSFLPHVFEYFQQEDGSTTRKFGGLGLGLAIVQQIVEMHKGTVRAESQGENQGATFIVQLPAMQQATPMESEPTRTQADTEAALDNIQILLVDDDGDTREFQAFLLQQSGAKVTAVTSGFEALQALDRLIPDVVVSDVGMAKMDGYMLMQQIRSRRANQGGTVRAIALTAYATELDGQRAIQAGFQMHITKPVEPKILVSKIVSLLKHNI
ncbi:MAG: response regulator [Nostoc sp. DedVER02]|uniref:response regulator n=1 Tax=unclassified Nostoc TaxID=2593658 RepID=UPI002AD37696|nr:MULTISPECIES: response regulator [unclassified Nostoc]MDZ7986294.1 response regulator [Nostoc sp. DedVER02]MDZ8112684.1 response regulator [Nostoc sp. DedVER01b]